ncbi:MAG: redoxin domain-containing protein [Gemmatimonadales bacterium]
MDAYRDQYATLLHNGDKVVLVAISVDAAAELTSWAQDRKYPFRLLSDPLGVVGKAYGAFESKYTMDNRTLFVVAPGGTISYVANPFQEIDPKAYTDLAAAIEEVRK